MISIYIPDLYGCRATQVVDQHDHVVSFLHVQTTGRRCIGHVAQHEADGLTGGL
jgi:hypothetical protein